MTIKPLKDADIPNTPNEEKIQDSLANNHLAKEFSKLGKALLEKTEQPNVITYAQFEPFIPMFNTDKERYENDENYKLSMNRLFNQYRISLGINLYQPTIVIESEANPIELCVLDRLYTRFKSDNVLGEAKRNAIPAAISRVSDVTRDDLVLKASLSDLFDANNTEEQKDYFAKARIESAIIYKKFVERNMTKEKADQLISSQSGIENEDSPVVEANSIGFEINDDDEE